MTPLTPGTGWGPIGMEINWNLTMPIGIVVLTALAAMMTDAFSKRKEYTALVSVAGLLLAIFACLRLWGNYAPATFAPSGPLPLAGYGQLTADNYSLFLNILFLSVGVLTVWMSHDEIAACRAQHRSPLLMQCVTDYLQGQRAPLSLLHSHTAFTEVANG